MSRCLKIVVGEVTRLHQCKRCCWSWFVSIAKNDRAHNPGAWKCRSVTCDAKRIDSLLIEILSAESYLFKVTEQTIIYRQHRQVLSSDDNH